MPSRNEPFGIVVLEAWSCYKPVIATTCGGPRDFVTSDVDGILVVRKILDLLFYTREAIVKELHKGFYTA